MLPSGPKETPILPPRPNRTATPGAIRSTLSSGLGGGAAAGAAWARSKTVRTKCIWRTPSTRDRASYLGRSDPEVSSMTDLTAFPITARWPAQHPDRIQLYGLPTPNGVKVSIMLEETGLPYAPHLVDIMKNESWTPEFLSLNPNGKIPAIIDPNGPGGKPLGLFESGAILIYLAEKTGQFLPADAARRYETI